MPELPEVETITRQLAAGINGAPPLAGQTFSAARLLWARTLAEPADPRQLNEALPGQSVLSIERRAKFIHLRLSRASLLIHLRMSGDLRVEPQSAALLPHDRAVFELASGWRLAFNDARKFGRVWYTSDPVSLLAHLGPEPFDPTLTSGRFHGMLSERGRQLKPLLLDQAFIAGLGNIYTDEALNLAHLHPLTSSDRLSLRQSTALLAAIRAVLEEGIRRNGASIDWVYRGGDFQNYFRVYQRTGQPCLTCGTPVERITVGQRGTHFCPVCQPLPG